MKKLFPVFVAAALCTSAATAQNNDQNLPYWSARASYDLTTSSQDAQLLKPGSGGSIGVVYVRPLASRFYTQFGVMGTFASIKIDGSKELSHSLTRFKGHLNAGGFIVQGDFGWKFVQNSKVRLSLYTGPRIYINISVKTDYTEYRTHNDFHIDKPVSKSGCDIGWNVGLGVDIAHHWHVFVQGEMSFSNLASLNLYEPTGDGNSHISRAGLQVGIGYNFDTYKPQKRKKKPGSLIAGL